MHHLSSSWKKKICFCLHYCTRDGFFCLPKYTHYSLWWRSWIELNQKLKRDLFLFRNFHQKYNFAQNYFQAFALILSCLNTNFYIFFCCFSNVEAVGSDGLPQHPSVLSSFLTLYLLFISRFSSLILVTWQVSSWNSLYHTQNLFILLGYWYSNMIHR